MFAMATVAGVMGVMSNHTYRYRQQTRLQHDGGSIGNQLAGEVADVVMAWWTGVFLGLAATATAAIMPAFILESGLYIDDDNLFYFIPPLGTRWNDEQKMMLIDQDKVEEDRNCQDDVRTMREVTRMANSICPIIQMTSDCPGNYGDQKMPLLDLKVWMSGGAGRQRVMFEFYRKPMATRLLIMARSAMPSRTKRASLTQEALRIMRNCCPDIPWERRAELLSDFCLRMKISGYPQLYRKGIIESTLAAWDKILEEDRTGERPLYRERAWRREERQKEKEKKAAGWYKQLGGKKSDFPIFCPMSPGGRLAERWRKVAEEVRRASGGKVRPTIVEQPGLPISALLVDSLAGELDDCGKEDCNPCQTGTTRKLSCRRVTLGGMVYNASCLTCRERGVREGEVLASCYHGRTCRCLYSRQKEHFAGLAGQKEDNPLWKHKENFHPQEDNQIVIEAERFFQDTPSHQIFEGICINNSPSSPGMLMNSRAEYEQGAVARVVIARGL